MDESNRKTVEDRLEIMEKTLVGDLASQRAGLMQNMLKLMEDIYDKEGGLKPRVERVERKLAYQAAWACGAAAVVTVVYKVGEKVFDVVK